ncbi:MAG: hypothetical protein WBE91_15275 [Steroidobacteraceae bacterium]
MPSTTAATDPLSYYEVLSTLWAAAHAARGTDLRGQSLINLDVLNPVPDGFVAELGSKPRPAGIEDGFRQAGSGESRGIDVADADAPILAYEPRGQLMQEVPATIRDFGLNGPDAGFVPGTLRDGERPLVSAIEARRLDLLARRKGRQGFEAKVDADLPGPMLAVFRDLDLQIQVPAAASILSEAAAANLSLHGPAEPQPASPLEEDHRIAIPANCASRLEGDPSQGLSAAPSRPLAVRISREGQLFADRLHGIRMKTQELAAAEGELDQVEARGPVPVVPASGFLGLPAIVPNPVHLPRLPLELPTGGRILDPVAIGQYHLNIVVDGCCENKTDAKHPAGIFTLDLPSADPDIGTVFAAMRLDSGSQDGARRRPRICRSWHLSLTASPERRGYRRGESG